MDQTLQDLAEKIVGRYRRCAGVSRLAARSRDSRADLAPLPLRPVDTHVDPQHAAPGSPPCRGRRVSSVLASVPVVLADLQLTVSALPLSPTRRIPGSGKSTLAGPLTQRINVLLAAADGARASDGEGLGGARPTTANTAICVGLDGWHHTREALGRFPDPDAARARRVCRLLQPAHARASTGQICC